MALEEFTSGGSRDFRQRYLNVFGYFPTGGSEVLVKVTEVDNTKTVFVDERGLSYTAYADKGVMFKFIPVTKRLFFHDSELCLVTRKPARQYQRGITYENTNMQTVFGGGVEIDFDSIHSYSKNKQHKGDSHNLLLNDMLAIYASSLFLYNHNIGYVSGKSIALTNPLFKQEVSDAIRDKGLNYEVVV